MIDRRKSARGQLCWRTWHRRNSFIWTEEEENSIIFTTRRTASLGYLCPYFGSSVDHWPLHPRWCNPVEAFLWERLEKSLHQLYSIQVEDTLYRWPQRLSSYGDTFWVRLQPEELPTSYYWQKVECRGGLTWYIIIWWFDSCRKVCVLRYGMSVVIKNWQLW